MDIELTLLVGAGSGLVSGALAGLPGIGGGLVVMPLLYACLPLLGVDAVALPRAAVATALGVLAATQLHGRLLSLLFVA